MILLVTFFVFGCSNKQLSNDLNVAHSSCYNYSYGERDFEKDYDKAFKWCTIAAEFNEPSSVTLLAELYLMGNGTSKDLAKAHELYLKAAKQDHLHAQLMVFLISNLYMYEATTHEEKVEGVMYLEKARDRGYRKAIDVYNQAYGKEI
ncbi:tetratricopeptide repeat protein [Agarivorans sp. JK6]|uniref:tetratricopeptide repeat protein n=1 Tax=Agarivorans sp. JK6 TaxID=2997426 RepID=UPI003873A8F7